MAGVDSVRDNPALSRYEMDVDGGVAFLRYRRRHGVVALLHAEVPAPLRGRGVGSRLARATLDFIRAQGEKAIVRCAFVAAYLARHPEQGPDGRRLSEGAQVAVSARRARRRGVAKSRNARSLAVTRRAWT
jgi:predicted GNAT family acetyltransferase